MQKKNIVIVGGGPSGLMAAELLATAGYAVTVYDRMPSLGRKFLMAGRGGLNLTHSEDLGAFINRYGLAAEWLAPHIRAFDPAALRAWCEALGQETFIGTSGRIFPRSMKAAPLLRAWLRRLEQLGVRYHAHHHWLGFEGDALRFENAQKEKILVTADATLLAMGGGSWPRLGSDAGWAPVLAECGVDIAPIRSANCGFLAPWSDYFRDRFAGQPLKPVTLTFEGASQQGEVMITTQGIEGGPVYALSAPLRDAITSRGSATLYLDLRPGMSVEALQQKLDAPRASKSFSTYIRRAGFPPLTVALLRESMSPAELTKATPATLAARLKALPLTLTGISNIARAISTAGGITRGALTDDFMLREKPGVFAAGEMLDWEAPTGGYLLQACFSTGVAAAKGMQRYINA